MEKTYTLNEHEASAIQSLVDQYAGTQKEITQKQQALIGLQGAYEGSIQLIARQQGLIVSGAEKLEFDQATMTLKITTAD